MFKNEFRQLLIIIPDFHNNVVSIWNAGDVQSQAHFMAPKIL